MFWRTIGGSGRTALPALASVGLLGLTVMGLPARVVGDSQAMLITGGQEPVACGYIAKDSGADGCNIGCKQDNMQLTQITGGSSVTRDWCPMCGGEYTKEINCSLVE